ncbi:MAG: hypothetical protein AB1791_08910 [Chloroflexota bacterium]
MYRAILFALILLGLTVWIGRWPGPAVANPLGVQCQIDVAPAEPSSHEDIEIVVSGTWPDGCVPEYDSYQMTGNRVSVFTVTSSGGGCLPVATEWSATAAIGRLPIGEYTAEALVDGSLCALRSFDVRGRAFLPIVIGGHGLARLTD